jgi:HSP20 family protein
LGEIEGEFRSWPALVGWPYRATAMPVAPRVEIFEARGRVYVRAEVPGMTSDDLRVSVTAAVLTVEGHYSDQREGQGRSFFVCEREYGAFSRTVTLPVDIDPEGLEWDVTNGLLTVSAPIASLR